MNLSAQQKYEARRIVVEKMRGQGLEPTEAMVTDLYAAFVNMVEEVLAGQAAKTPDLGGWSDKLS